MSITVPTVARKGSGDVVNPNLSFDTNVDDTSSKSFVTSSQNKNYTYGDLFDKSAEASQKRAEKYGKDPIKEKQYANYRKQTNGKLHPQEMKDRWEKTKAKADKVGLKIED